MKKIKSRLEERRKQNALRRLTVRSGLTDFFSNDYLGISRNQEVVDEIHKEYLLQSGNLIGSTGSRLLSGHSTYAEELEIFLAEYFKAPKVLLFNSGYNANLSILASVPQKGDTIISDELIHASLKDGARLSFATRFTFRHNDLDDLRNKIDKATGDVFVVVESVYSMDGDIAPLKELVELCEEKGANLVLDEAHSTGLYGNGAGLAVELGLQDRIFCRVHTFGKGPGVHGSVIAGADWLIDYLINFARPFIYTTALPVHALISIKKSLQYIAKHQELVQQLRGKIELYKSEIKNSGLVISKEIDSPGPIQVICIPGVAEVKAKAETLSEAGFDVRPILSPTVKEGEERLRICLHVFNTDQEIRNLVQYITN
jgi:8-amino-7-oxononanoate synthase